MILVTGAGGLTGQAVIKALAKKGIEVCALVHRESQSKQMVAIGAQKAVVGDMLNPCDLQGAMDGADSVYFICSTANSDECAMGQMAIDAAEKAGIKHFIYHSVLHSILREMPHHRQKNDVENLLVNSRLAYTILQPAVLMQNLQMALEQVRQEGIWNQKFFTEKDTRLCMVDLNDVAEAAARIVQERERHTGATYELCGPENLRMNDIRRILETRYHREITVNYTPDEVILNGLRKSGASEYRQDAMLKMFHHYNEADFLGSDVVLASLLGRKSHTLAEYLEQEG